MNEARLALTLALNIERGLPFDKDELVSCLHQLAAEVERLTTSESNLAAHVGALARTNGRKDATLLNVLEFCEFLWRDVTLNDYAQEKLDATIAAITKEIK